MLRDAILIVLAATACSAIVPERARAEPGFDIDVCPIGCEIALVGVLVVPPIVFATAQIAYAAQARWFPLGWAIPELIYGGLATTLMIGVGADSNDAGGAAGFAVVYGWLTLHAILSIALDDPDERARARAAPARSTMPSFAGAPIPGGAVLGVTGFW